MRPLHSTPLNEPSFPTSSLFPDGPFHSLPPGSSPHSSATASNSQLSVFSLLQPLSSTRDLPETKSFSFPLCLDPLCISLSSFIILKSPFRPSLSSFSLIFLPSALFALFSALFLYLFHCLDWLRKPLPAKQVINEGGGLRKEETEENNFFRV